ncbi:MAG: thymidylate synthase [Nitrososphaeraceae archaeon]
MNQYHDYQYLNLMRKVLDTGVLSDNRTGIKTIGIFADQMRFDLSDGTIPLLTTKSMHWSSVMHELFWYISGSTNNNDLEKNKVSIWSEWADEDGNLGPLYGHQLRNWNNQIDQLQTIVDTLIKNPLSRRMVVSYWDPTLLPDENIPLQANAKIGKQNLAPCHYTWQVYTKQIPSDKQELYPDKQRSISLLLTQRSADFFLGVPYNISQYSILLHMLAHITNMIPGEFIWSGGDIHIYENHLDVCNKQLTRSPYPSPTIKFARNITNINDFVFEDIMLENYQSHPILKGRVAV